MKKSLIALAFGTLALGMSEFVMMGILPDIARSLGVSIPEAGHLISAYALGVCFGAPLMVLVARKRLLKQILLALTAMIAAGNLCASLAPDYWSLLGLRFVSGLPHGAFFGVGSIVAERVADAGKRTEAVSIMIVGMTVANLFGVPLGTYISNVLTWRATFGIVAVWGVVALLLVRLWVPRMEPLPDTGLKGQFRFLRSLAPWLVLLSVMLGNGGIFCWYSYVSPLMIHASGFTADDLTLIIMLAGFGMFAGNIIGGHFSDRFTPEKVVRFTLGHGRGDAPRDLLRGARPLPLRRPDGALHGMSVLCFVAPAAAYSGEFARRRDAGGGFGAGGIQSGQCAGRLLRRPADRPRAGVSLYGSRGHGIRPARFADRRYLYT